MIFAVDKIDMVDEFICYISFTNVTPRWQLPVLETSPDPTCCYLSYSMPCLQ